MGNPPRFIPEGALVEVTTRTIHGRLLLLPSRELNEIIDGILARAAERTGVGVAHFIALSNHLHILAVPPDAQALASFMEYVNGNLAREAGRLHGWKQKFWGRRYRAIVVSDEPRAQEDRLFYLLQNGPKEGLVVSPKEWPGATGVHALLTGEPVTGWWHDRTAAFEARRRGEKVSKYSHGEKTELRLVPLPCWKDLSPHERQRRVADMVRKIERETRETLEAQGRTAMGKKRILRQNPHDMPASSSSSPAPRFHTATWEARKSLEIEFWTFVRAFRAASEELRAGKLDAVFPRGSFPPRLPFVRGKPPDTAAALPTV